MLREQARHGDELPVRANAVLRATGHDDDDAQRGICGAAVHHAGQAGAGAIERHRVLRGAGFYKEFRWLNSGGLNVQRRRR